MSWDRRDGVSGLDGAALPSSLAQLLESERAAPPPGAERLGRLEARLGQTLGVGAFAAPAPDAAAASAVEGSGALLGGAPTGSSGGLLAQLGATVSKPLFAALLAAGLGTGTYVGVYHAVSLGHRVVHAVVPAAPLPPLPPAPPLPPLASPPSAAAALGTGGAAPADGAEAIAELPAPPARRAPRPATRARDLAAELEALGRARASLREDPQRALAELRAHERAFPTGRLTLEREVLIIEALARAGDGAAAEARAETFRRRHPGSTLEPALARALSAGR